MTAPARDLGCVLVVLAVRTAIFFGCQASTRGGITFLSVCHWRFSSVKIRRTETRMQSIVGMCSDSAEREPIVKIAIANFLACTREKQVLRLRSLRSLRSGWHLWEMSITFYRD